MSTNPIEPISTTLSLTQWADAVRAMGAPDHQRPTEAQLREVAYAFERILMQIMLHTMRQAVPESAFPPKAPGHDLYQSLLDNQIAEQAIPKTFSLGLADAIVRQYAGLLERSGRDTNPPNVTPNQQQEIKNQPRKEEDAGR